MRKFLRIFFWSHGTLLGYLGSLSQKGLPEIFSKWVLINLSNPLRHPVPLVDPLLTKNLDTAGPWCAVSKKGHFHLLLCMVQRHDTIGSEKSKQTKIVLVTKPYLTQDFPQLTRGHHCYTFKGMPQSRI